MLKQLLILICVALPVYSAAATMPAEKAKACPLPTLSNVTYTQVTKLPVSEPSFVIPYGEDELQFAELWLPQHEFASTKPPLVVLIHGGCWLNAFDIQHTHALSSALAASGYAVWSIEYRRTGDAGGGWPGSFNDIKQAIEYVLSEHGLQLNPQLTRDAQNQFDATNIAIIGHSAGGHLALLAGAHFNQERAIKSVIGLAAITDIARYAAGTNSCESATAKFMGGDPEDIANDYAKANPTQVTLHPNTMLLHGEQDTIVSPSQALLLPEVPVTMIADAGHFDMIHSGTPSFQALLKALAKSL